MVQQALAHLGEALPEEISAFIARWHGVTIAPQYIPVIRATLRGQELLARLRKESMLLAEKIKEEQRAGV
jgi:hypothetical protein